MRTLLVTAFVLSAASGVFPADEIKIDIAAAEKKVLELTNAERAKEGLKALTWNPVLAKVARAHAQNMAKQQKEVHILDGKNPYDRIKAAGYDYRRAGENVGSMTPDFELPDLMKAWMDSKGHRANILQGEYEEAGIGAAVGENGRIYFAQEFGKPKKK
ncbi:MAG: CAP domain-containing protein [Gemmataceae bacterium]